MGQSSNVAGGLRQGLVRDLVHQNLAQLGKLPADQLVKRWRVRAPRVPRLVSDLTPETVEALPATARRRRSVLRALGLLICLGYVCVFGTSAFRQPSQRQAAQHGAEKPTWNGELLADLNAAASLPGGLPMSLAQMFQLRVRRVVIDPGHGGKDPGCKAAGGLEEKTVTLQIARSLATLLEKRLGAEVILTRTDDEYMPLDARAELANRLEADLFLSIHLNWFPTSKIQRIETYFVGLANDKESLDLASRENAGGELPLSEFEVVLRRMAQTLKVQESRRFADLVQGSLFREQVKENPKLRDHGVGRAPFVVLMGTHMPSILTEVSFLSDPAEAKRLESPKYIDHIALALADGIAGYLTAEGPVAAAVTTASVP